MTEILIRAANQADIEALAEIQVFSWRNAYKNSVPDHYLYKNLSVSRRIAAFTILIDKTPEAVLVSSQNEIVTGYMIAGASRDEDLPHAYELQAIYIDPGFQRQGIGTLLAQQAERMATSLGHQHLIVWALDKNENSKQFYKKCGYLEEGRKDYIDYLAGYRARFIKTLK